MAGVAGAEEPPESQPPERDSKGLAVKIVAGIVAVALVGYGAYRVASQKRTPSGAREASPIGPPAVPGLGEITVTCSPTLQGARGNVFSAALDIPASGQAWDQRTFEGIRSELASLASEANPGFHIRVGVPHALPGHDGRSRPGPGEPAPLDWRRALEPGSKTPRIDDLVASIRQTGAEPQVDIGYFAKSPQEAGALVAFLNGVDPADPEVSLRRASGRDDPARVDLFELGSRPPQVSGNSSIQAAMSYGREIEDLAQAMRSRSPTPLKLLAPLADWRLQGVLPAAIGQLIDETKANVDGYTISFSPPADAELYGSVAKLEETLGEVRQLIAERVPGKNMTLAVAPWGMSSFGGPSGPTWKTALAAAAGAVTAARGGASIANYPGIPASPEHAPGYTYWPGGDPRRPSPVYTLIRALADQLPRELLNTELTYTTTTATEAEAAPTPRPPRPPVTTEGLVAQCASEESDRHLVVLNLSANPAVMNVKVGFQAGERMTRSVLVAPPESSAVEDSKTVFVARNWFSDSIPPHSVTVWTFPRGTM